jgi:hypothetical protein
MKEREVVTLSTLDNTIIPLPYFRIPEDQKPPGNSLAILYLVAGAGLEPATSGL